MTEQIALPMAGKIPTLKQLTAAGLSVQGSLETFKLTSLGVKDCRL